MPQLDPTVFVPQIFWLAVVFAVLYIFMARSAAPKISDVLKKRQDAISDDLAEAEVLQAKAEKARLAYEKSQEDARNNAAAIVLNKRDELKAEAEAAQQKLSDEIAKNAAQAQQRIEAAKEKALGDIRDVATDVCAEIVSKVAGLELDKNAISKVVGQKADNVTKGDG